MGRPGAVIFSCEKNLAYLTCLTFKFVYDMGVVRSC